MTFNYAKIAATASALVAKFGQAITVTRVAAGGAYDPATGAVEGGTAVAVNGIGVALDYAQREIDGTIIQSGDRRILIAASLSITPSAGDSLALAGGQMLRVMSSKPLSPAGIIVLHEVQARGI